MPGIKINNHHLLSLATQFLDKFNSATKDKKKLALFDEYSNKYDLLARCDDVGNTVLHIVIIKSSLPLLCQVLEKLPKKYLNCKNDLNETPLFQAVSDGADVCALALKEYGASLRIKNKKGLSAASLEKNQPKGPFKTNELRAYLQAEALLADPNPVRDYLQIAKNVLALGFHLQQPISTHKQSLLHWLIKNAPCYVVENLVNATPDFNVNLDLVYSNYLCEAIINRRWSMVRFFLKLGSKIDVKDIYGKSAIEHALDANIDLKKIKREKRLTVYEALLAIVNAYSPRLAGFNKGENFTFLFSAFIQFTIAQQWQYSPSDTDYSDNRFIFDVLVGEPCTVNCFNMAECLNEMLHMAGFENSKLHIYKNITSIPFMTKPQSVVGSFTCFDAEYHQKVLAKIGYYQFSQHCIVEVDGIYADPTMCCFYNHENAVVLSPTKHAQPTPKVRFVIFSTPQQNFASIDFQVVAAKLSVYFESIGWDLILRRKSLCAISRSGDQSVDLSFDDDESMITFSEPDPKKVAMIVQTVMHASPHVELGLKLLANQQLAVAIAKQLKADQFNFASLVSISDGKQEIKDVVMTQLECISIHQKQKLLIFSGANKHKNPKNDIAPVTAKRQSLRGKMSTHL